MTSTRKTRNWVLAITAFAAFTFTPLLLRGNFDSHDPKGALLGFAILAACILSFVWLKRQPSKD